MKCHYNVIHDFKIDAVYILKTISLFSGRTIMPVIDLVHATKTRALKIISTRISKENADFAFSKIPQESVKQFNVEGVGTVDVPVSELVSCLLTFYPSKC